MSPMASLLANTARVLGGLSLLCAGLILCAQCQVHHSGAWFPGLFDRMASTFVPLLVVLGLLGFVYAAFQSRADREPPMELGLKPDSEKKDT